MLRASTLATKAAALLRYAEAAGLDAGPLLAAARIARPALAHAGARVDTRAIVDLWRAIGRSTGGADVGLRLAESEDSCDAYGVVGFRAMTSASVRESLLVFVRYIRLIADGSDAYVHESADVLSFGLSLPDVVDPVGRWMAERAIASCIVLMRAWTGESIRARRVAFRHAAPRDTSAYARVFGCRIDFDQPTNVITFDRAIAHVPLRTAQVDVARYLESLANAASAQLPAGGAGDAVAHVLRDEIARGDPGIAAVARALGMSVRTLQRRLHAERLAYSIVVDRVRRDIAVRLVTTTALPLAVVRDDVGFADERAFRRAFRRWTGSSPAELRRA